jgi:hypothetical protein
LQKPKICKSAKKLQKVQNPCSLQKIAVQGFGQNAEKKQNSWRILQIFTKNLQSPKIQ